MNPATAVTGMVLSLYCSLSIGAEPDSVENLVLTFTAEKEQFTVGEEIWVRVTFENQGKEPVRIVRPRADTITRIGEYGTLIYIDGPGGKYGLFPEPREIKPVLDENIIELAPGEFVGTRVRVDHYGLLSDIDRPYQAVGETPGKYTAVLKYHPREDGPFLLKEEKLADLFLGTASSSPIEFEVLKRND